MKTLALFTAGIILFPLTITIAILLPVVFPAEYEKAKRGESNMEKYFYSVEVFPFSELSDEAKETAMEKFIQDQIIYFDYQEELYDTAKAFCNMLNIEYRSADWSGYDPVDYRTGQIDDTVLQLSGIRLMKYLYNNYFSEIYTGKFYWKGIGKSRKSNVIKETCCPLTGMCFDCYILEPLINCMNGKYAKNQNYTFSDMISDCFDSWQKTAEKQYEYCCSEEYFTDWTENNELFFSGDGSQMYSKSEIQKGA